MANSNEQKFEIDMKIVENFIEAKKNLDQLTEALKNAENNGMTTKEKLQEITLELSKAKSELKNAQGALEGAAEGQTLLNSITEDTNKSLAQMQKDLSALRNIPFDNLPPEKIQEINQKMNELSESIENSEAKLKSLDSKEVFVSIAGGLNSVIAGVFALSTAFSMLGVENETLQELENSTAKLVGTMQALSIISEFVGKAKYKVITVTIAQTAATIKDTITRNLNAASVAMQNKAQSTSLLVKAKDAVVTKLITAATWLWNAAMSANPIGMMVIAVAALTAGILALVFAMDKDASAAKKAADAEAAYQKQLSETNVVLSKLEANSQLMHSKRLLQGRQEIAELKKNGASKEEIAARQQQIESEARQIEIKGLQEAWRERKKLQEAQQQELQAQRDLLGTMDAGSRKYEEQSKKVNELTVAYNQMVASMNADSVKIANLQQDQADATLESEETQKAAREQAAQHAYDSKVKHIESLRNLELSRLKADTDYLSEDFAIRQQFTQQEYQLDEQAAKDKLELDKRYGKISREEYDNQLAILDNNRQAFQNEQVKATQTYYSQLQASISSLLAERVEDQLDEVDRVYNQAIEDLGKIELPQMEPGMNMDEYKRLFDEYEQLLLDRAATELALEQEKENKKADIRKQAQENSISEIQKRIEETYGGDLRKYADNESEKLRVTIEALNAEKELRRDAGLETYDQEVALRDAQSKLIQHELNANLMNEQLSAEQKYNLKTAAFEKERELYVGNEDKLKEIDIEQAEAYQEMLAEKLEAFEEWSNQTLEIMNVSNELFNALDEAEMQKYGEENQRKKDELQARLDAGLISQAEYDKGVAKLDAELDQKKKEIERQQAVREKATKIFEIGVNTASAIAKALPNIPLAVIAGVMGAVQLATVIATPLPKAAKGGYIQGTSHAQGGVLIEAEGGEAVINKKSVSKFGPLLSAINEMGGGVPFAAPMSDGGFAVRTTQQTTATSSENLSKALTEAISQLRIVTTVEDIRRADAHYTEIENRASF